jgi:hypothetical protein
VNQFDEIEIRNRVTYFDDGMDAITPLSLLGPDDGLLNFKITSSVKVSASGYSGWLGVMPDVGQPAIKLEPTGAPPND